MGRRWGGSELSSKGELLVLGIEFDVLDRIRKLGYKTVLINDECPADVEKYQLLSGSDSRDHRYDVEDFKGLISAGLKGIIVCSEDYVNLGAEICERFAPQLKGLSTSQAKIVRDKWLLKKTLGDLKIPTTKVLQVNSASSYFDISKQLGQSFLMKPRRGWLAQGMELIVSPGDWQKWLNRNIENLDDFIAEEFLKNITEYCCDTVVVNGRIYAQFPGEYSVSCLESSQSHEGIGVNFPGFLPTGKIEEMKQYTKTFIEKLGIQNAYCHTEFLFDGNGWHFGEMGCRLPGGYQLPTESYIAGTNLMDTYLKIFTQSESVPDGPIETEGRYYGYYLFPKKAGVVKKVRVEFEHPWIVESKVYVREGQVLEHEDSSVSMSAHVVYSAKSLDELKELAGRVKNLCSVEIGLVD